MIYENANYQCQILFFQNILTKRFLCVHKLQRDDEKSQREFPHFLSRHVLALNTTLSFISWKQKMTLIVTLHKTFYFLFFLFNFSNYVQSEILQVCLSSRDCIVYSYFAESKS